MAKGIIKNKFKIFELTPQECKKLGWGCQEGVICDDCNTAIPFNSDEPVYFVAVLNDVLCKNCYEEFINKNKWYVEDKDYELENYYNVLSQLMILEQD